MAEMLTDASPEVRQELEARQKIIDGLSKVKAETGEDNFIIRVMRRESPNKPLESVAGLFEATVEHLQYPEAWLPQLAGGSGTMYLLQIYHASDKTRTIASMKMIIPGAVKKVNANACLSADWVGPKVDWPKPENILEVPAISVEPVRPVPVMTTQQNAQANISPITGQDNFVARLEHLKREEDLINQKKRDIEIESIKREAQARVEEATRRSREIETQMADLRKAQQLMATVQPPVQPPIEAKPSLDVAGIVTALAPVVVGLMQASKQASLDMAKMQMEMAAKSDALQARLAQEAAETNKMLMTAMMNKPAVDPLLLQILNKPDSSAALVEKFAVNFGSMATTMMQILQMSVDTGLVGNQGGESPWPKIAMGAIGAFQEIAKSAQASQIAAIAQQNAQAAMPRLSAVPDLASNEVPKASEVVKAAEPSKLEVVLTKIRSEEAPESVAKYTLDNVMDPTVMGAITANGGDFIKTISEMLGDFLNDETQEYVQTVLLAIGTEANKRGMVSADQLKQFKEALEIDDEQEESEGETES